MTKERFEEIRKRKYAEDRVVYIVFKGDEKATALHIVYDNEWLLAHRNLKDVYETKEEAEWKFEFGNVTRTEKLELPTWERFKVYSYFGFAGKNIYHCYMEDDINEKNERVISVCGKEFDFTYDGYLEACRLCKKLFLEGK